MTNEELKNLGEDDQQEVRRAFRTGARACVFLAREFETFFKDLSEMDSLDARHLIPLLECYIDPTMQALGDALSNMDAVDDEAEQATKAAFEAVASVLQKFGGCQETQRKD